MRGSNPFAVLVLGGLAIVLALANTNEDAMGGEPYPAAARLAGDPPPPLQRPSPAVHPMRPSEKLDMYEWMALMRELGWATEISEDEFFARLDAWDQEQLDSPAPAE